MPLSPNRRRDLTAIVALAVGLFLGLSLLPITLTGPVGRIVGSVLWKTLGLGSVAFPMFALALGLSDFRWLPRFEIKRTAVLAGGLAALVPFAIGIAVGIRSAADLPASWDNWSSAQQLVGILPAFFTVSIISLIGTAGSVLLGLLGFSALTVHTLGWHPFTRLKRPEPGSKPLKQKKVKKEKEQEKAPSEIVEKIKAPPKKDSDKKTKPVVVDPTSFEEQAFISEAAVEPFSWDLMDPPDLHHAEEDEAELDRLGEVLVDTLKTFNVRARLGDQRSTGPVVTQFEVAPEPGVKVGRIAALADDLALKMEAKSIRIVAPIPGKAFVGVEVPNPTPRMVRLSELLQPPAWNPKQPGLPVALGMDLEGDPVVADLAKMPHLLIAGATGSGKSVCINTIITSLIFRYNDRQLRMIMIDPKMVELTVYNALPHMLHPVVTNNKQAAKALKWAMLEMEKRYELFSVNNVRNLHEFNRKVKEGRKVVMPRPADDLPEEGEDPATRSKTVEYDGSTLPFIVVIVDELADLMMTVQAEVEKPLAILAQKARATGIHLILATQRPSVNVITGLIKANFPSRIAFRVASKVDSRTILDQNGAETLLGNGDMLFLPPGISEPIRLQGAFIDTRETERVTDWYTEETERRTKKQGVSKDEVDIIAQVEALEAKEESGEGMGSEGERDQLFREAAEVCLQNQGGSTSLLQRKLRIGYGRAARIVDQLFAAGILGPADGSKPREVLIGAEQLDEYCGP